MSSNAQCPLPTSTVHNYAGLQHQHPPRAISCILSCQCQIGSRGGSTLGKYITQIVAFNLVNSEHCKGSFPFEKATKLGN